MSSFAVESEARNLPPTFLGPQRYSALGFKDYCVQFLAHLMDDLRNHCVTFTHAASHNGHYREVSSQRKQLSALVMRPNHTWAHKSPANR